MEDLPRYQPCYILRDNRIPCVMWCEDAIAHYGVPTVVFSLYLLVPNINQAAEALVQSGWHLEDTQMRPTWTPGIGPPPLPSKEPPPGPTTTILLPASEWNYTFPETSHQNLIPSLPALLDGLIDKLLDDPLTESDFFNHLAMLILYLYDYSPDAKRRSFAEELKYDHRQFHYDRSSGMSSGLPFFRHERKIRDALRNGTYQLCDCSADRNDEELFTAKVEARLRALNPSPFSADVYETEKNEDEEGEGEDTENSDNN
ncbi:hypothetical protein DL98DRAFT_430557 [Cadophora sp. DSE1049]|nr:hypothetical protein DL98DRAFT_430557 [Cadophora sp. DSE1049]